jgi:uncharacterized protein (TIGR02722 family)
LNALLIEIDMKKTLQTFQVAKWLTILGFAGLMTACASGPTVSYGDARGVETINADFGSTDVQMIAESMTRSLLQSKVIAGSREAPLVTVAQVKNKTSEYIDTRMITSKIETQLLKSGQVRFAVRSADMKGQVGELTRQNSGMYSPDASVKLGQMQGAKYRIEGEIGVIEKNNGKIRDKFYNFSLRLINNESGVYEWADEQEIRKQEKR